MVHCHPSNMSFTRPRELVVSPLTRRRPFEAILNLESTLHVFRPLLATASSDSL